MDNVQEYSIYTNLPSSETLRSRTIALSSIPVLFFTLYGRTEKCYTSRFGQRHLAKC
jgi:hypothetical protein